MKTAKNSDSRTPYECKHPWPEDIFVQCGGQGIVVSSLEKALDQPLKTLKTLSGEKTNLSHYCTAFFEAFPKNPSCFLRGEGTTIEEAETEAYNQYQSILSCSAHEFDRKGRTDGYAFCTKCSYSSTVLEPLTTCVQCQTPTAKFQDKDKNHHCMTHYYALSVEQAVGEGLGMVKKEDWEYSFKKDKLLYEAMVSRNPNVTEKEFDKLRWNYWAFARSLTYQYKPLIGKQTKSDEECLQIIKDQLPNFLTGDKNGK